MRTHNLGYPKIGDHRELKKACESYWAGKSDYKTLQQTGKTIRNQNWLLQKELGIDLIPSNDFSFYDQVLDHSLMFGAIPKRYTQVISKEGGNELDLYFAMARGYQKNSLDVVAMEMTKWFDTNYHYIVPEFYKNQEFKLFSEKIINDFYEAQQLGIVTKPVLIGPVTYLLLGKEKESGFDKLDLIDQLTNVYVEIIHKLKALGVEYIQFDEPFLTVNLSEKIQKTYAKAYQKINAAAKQVKIILATYFNGVELNLDLATSIRPDVLHIDLVRAPEQLDTVSAKIPDNIILSLGVVDGRNIWKNDFEHSLSLIKSAQKSLGEERIWIAPSCSLMHSPCDLDNETDEQNLSSEIKNWLAFAKQKLIEVCVLKDLSSASPSNSALTAFEANKAAQISRRNSTLIHKQAVKNRFLALTDQESQRNLPFSTRRVLQQQAFKLPLYPTTTIGSFPQTPEVRSYRAKLKKETVSQEEYDAFIAQEIKESIRFQEEIDLDVLVHGEFERNDMVEYFGEKLEGFAFSKNGWVQSYGSRCVKPPIIYGDVQRSEAMTVKWSAYAQSLTNKWVKGMLTGPVTILQWSFVRNDQPRSTTCFQIALAIRDEVMDLEKAGINIIQIDEPAIREGLPLRKADWKAYLDWAVKAFRISAGGVKDQTQIHTHMCYSEFNDIISNIADMDADVITIETSRSQMELLDAFSAFKYPNEIGPGVYDIHSPRVPNIDEMINLLKKAAQVIPAENLWVNPDCGLKTRAWPETKQALTAMVAAAKSMRR